MKALNFLLISTVIISHCCSAQILNKAGAFSRNDSTKSHLQFSLVPGFEIVKTNHKETFKNYSVNLFVGNAKGIDGFQVSSLVNICNGNARYFQGAGLVNITNGTFEGFQGAGLVNMVNGKTNGMQGAGLINVSTDSVSGMQAAGLANGAIKHVEGVQAAGLFNYATTVNGVQMAGLFNCANHVKGSQLAGLFNVAKSVQGSQISVFNIADTVSGASIGFFSFVRKGYHKLELSADEIFYTNVAFRTGTTKFHNVFSIGISPEKKNKQLWTYGYGAGTTWKVKEKWKIDLDLSANNILKINSPLWGSEDSASLNKRNGRLNLNNKIYAGFEWQFAKKISLAAGPVINIMLTDDRNTNYADVFSKIRPNYIAEQKLSSHVLMNFWIGARIGLRFF